MNQFRRINSIAEFVNNTIVSILDIAVFTQMYPHKISYNIMEVVEDERESD